MSDPREICLRRPDLCGEPLWRDGALGTGTVDMAEVLKSMAREPSPLPVAEPIAELPELSPPASAPLFEAGVVVRHRGLLLSSYWELRNEASATLGDVVVVLPDRWYILRRVKKPAVWLEADERFYVPGRYYRQICAYGYVPRGGLEYVVQLARSGAIIAAMCDLRARVKPPRTIELQGLWRYDGYLVNLSPARIAVYHLDPYRGRRRFLADIAKRGCPIYSHWANQILQALGVLARLVC